MQSTLQLAFTNNVILLYIIYRFLVYIFFITANSKTELEPFEISARLNDIIVISAPVISSHTIYYLSKPNGDTTKLNLNITETNFGSKYYNKTLEKHISGKLKEIITPSIKYGAFNKNSEWCQTSNSLEDREITLMPNDFRIGPLIDEDHGNWVISAYYDNFGEWIEVFQVISLHIIGNRFKGYVLLLQETYQQEI